MIFMVNPRYRNCLSCGKKVSWRDRVGQIRVACPKCHAPFPAENTQQIQDTIKVYQERVRDERVLYSKFYEYHANEYHHIYALPLYTLEEVLAVENLLYTYSTPEDGEESQAFWYASYEPHREDDGMDIRCLTWQRRIWDAEREVFVAGPDEGPRTVVFTPWE